MKPNSKGSSEALPIKLGHLEIPPVLSQEDQWLGSGLPQAGNRGFYSGEQVGLRKLCSTDI